MVELIKEKLAITEDRGEITQLLTNVIGDLSISKVAEVSNISEYTARQACELRLQKGIISKPKQQRRVGNSEEIKQTVLAFFESKEISRLLPGKKGSVSIQLPDKTKMKKQKKLILSNISQICAQFKKDNHDMKIGFSTFALLCPKWCIPVGAAGTHVCLDFSPKCKTHAGSNEFVPQLQTNNRDICDVDNYECMIGHCGSHQC